jgi:L-galactono-1,4-lactone dehydrogenase
MERRFFPFLAAGAVTFLHHRHPLLCESRIDENCHVSFESQQHLSNWSSTHLADVRRVYEPKTERELERLLRYYQEKKQKIRPVGTALSPNGISFPDPGSDAVTVHHFNQIQVDPKKLVVKVGAGATVADVLKELSKYGLTLENFSSIQEQQIAGWTQIAAHGTGCLLPTVEEQIIEMKLVTPNAGLLTLSEENLPNGFRFAKVALGSFGVMTEATMRCIPELSLCEETTVLDRNTIRNSHYNRLRDYRHVRYMWIPYTSSVVSVVSNPVTNQSPPTVTTQEPIAPSSSEGLPTRALINVIKQSKSNTSPSPKDEFLIQQGFGSLRDIALGVGNPLDLQVTSSIITSPFSLSLSVICFCDSMSSK